jgi:hypothetical protein
MQAKEMFGDKLLSNENQEVRQRSSRLIINFDSLEVIMIEV